MKKTLIAVVCAAFVSTGAFAKPAHNPAPNQHNSHVVTQHHVSKTPHVASHHPAPAPRPHVVARHNHHHHNHGLDFGDALIAFAILATAM